MSGTVLRWKYSLPWRKRKSHPCLDGWKASDDLTVDAAKSIFSLPSHKVAAFGPDKSDSLSNLRRRKKSKHILRLLGNLSSWSTQEPTNSAYEAIPTPLFLIVLFCLFTRSGNENDIMKSIPALDSNGAQSPVQILAKDNLGKKNKGIWKTQETRQQLQNWLHF